MSGTVIVLAVLAAVVVTAALTALALVVFLTTRGRKCPDKGPDEE
jgi:hypothetical protein